MPGGEPLLNPYGFGQTNWPLRGCIRADPTCLVLGELIVPCKQCKTAQSAGGFHGAADQSSLSRQCVTATSAHDIVGIGMISTTSIHAFGT